MHEIAVRVVHQAVLELTGRGNRHRRVGAAHDVQCDVRVGRKLGKRLVIEGNGARLAFCNPDLPAFAVEELGEGVIWGVVRSSIRWHVARGQLS